MAESKEKHVAFVTHSKRILRDGTIKNNGSILLFPFSFNKFFDKNLFIEMDVENKILKLSLIGNKNQDMVKIVSKQMKSNRVGGLRSKYLKHLDNVEIQQFKNFIIIKEIQKSDEDDIRVRPITGKLDSSGISVGNKLKEISKTGNYFSVKMVLNNNYKNYFKITAITKEEWESLPYWYQLRNEILSVTDVDNITEFDYKLPHNKTVVYVPRIFFRSNYLKGGDTFVLNTNKDNSSLTIDIKENECAITGKKLLDSSENCIKYNTTDNTKSNLKVIKKVTNNGSDFENAKEILLNALNYANEIIRNKKEGI